ncbi:hypothetical protein NOR_05926 [Metarhizium rileyi]|uniref:Uncharacterized protein n=1 Tax=Metarhizium rileyi (strain RCEF 4871) TaxID=1649241 RepID=A0A167BSE9_METRR|nr:hypothetical protein NOR_05926 [Metarhizium rileyi RCEF 4871]TWU73738.1 hypothetical protein ED733_001116 [Metarhizium rileyi]
MTKPSHRSSLLQARDSRSHLHSHSFFHRFRHNPLHAHDPDQQPPGDDTAKDDGFQSHLGVNVELDSRTRALAERDLGTKAENAEGSAVESSQSSLVSQVHQPLLPVQNVDTRGSAYETKTVPEPLKPDSLSGDNVAISVGTSSSVALHGSTPGGSGHGSPSSNSTRPTALDPNVRSSVTAKSAFPNLGDVQNSTGPVTHGNSTSFVAPANSSSTYKLNSGSTIPTTNLTGTSTNIASNSTQNFNSTSSASSSFSTPSLLLSSPTTTFDPVTTSTTSSGNGYGILTVPGNLPTTQPKTGTSSGPDLTPQQKQVIGGVVGAVAGVAFIGFLLMLFLRYKKKGSHTIFGSQSGGAASRALGDGTSGNSGSGGATAEWPAVPGAVAAALVSLSGKRAPPASQSSESGERGFYRVSGRKLPSVLHNGGDGYSDPRGSAISDCSDYYRGSQAFEPTSTGGGQLSLGAPMRPVSGGVPIMRSGPARNTGVPKKLNSFRV